MITKQYDSILDLALDYEIKINKPIKNLTYVFNTKFSIGKVTKPSRI